MKIKIQIKNAFGSILFELERENNTVKETLQEAAKRGANLCGANLRDANLRGANLCGANLCDANLCDANLCDANLRDANLCDANLRGANLCDANLRGANLCETKNADHVIAQTRILPEGDLIVYKKAWFRDSKGNNKKAIIKLLVPKEAKRSSAFGRKCRAEYADVLELPEGVTECFSDHDPSFIYRKGERVSPKEPFSDDWKEECASGIHFFITRLEAENY
jgi:hypothetical protein